MRNRSETFYAYKKHIGGRKQYDPESGMRLAAEIHQEQYRSALLVRKDYINICDSTATTHNVVIIQAMYIFVLLSIVFSLTNLYKFEEKK